MLTTDIQQLITKTTKDHARTWVWVGLQLSVQGENSTLTEPSGRSPGGNYTAHVKGINALILGLPTAGGCGGLGDGRGHKYVKGSTKLLSSNSHQLLPVSSDISTRRSGPIASGRLSASSPTPQSPSHPFPKWPTTSASGPPSTTPKKRSS